MPLARPAPAAADGRRLYAALISAGQKPRLFSMAERAKVKVVAPLRSLRTRRQRAVAKQGRSPPDRAMTKASNRKDRLQPTGAPIPLGAAGLAAGVLLATVLTSSPAVAVSPAPPPPESFATSQTGDALWAACGGSPAGRVPSACSAYIVGASDGVALAAASARPFCLDARVQADELAEVVRRYMAAHPQSRSNSAAAVVAAALGAAYPCRPGVWR